MPPPSTKRRSIIIHEMGVAQEKIAWNINKRTCHKNKRSSNFMCYEQKPFYSVNVFSTVLSVFEAPDVHSQ